MKISVITVCFNAAETIADTMASIRCQSHPHIEYIIVDGGSTDDTLNIAGRFSNVVLHQGAFKGFGKMKQVAVQLASNDWVLSVDADECASPELVDYLRNWDAEQSAAVVGVIPRHNYLMEQRVKYGGWGNDRLVRLFNRTVHNFNDNDVHESIAIDQSSMVVNIPYVIHHNAVQRIGQFLEKVNLYTEIRRETSSKTYPPFIIFSKAVWRFFESYILRAGFLSGWRGLVVAWSKSNEVFFKYIKIYADKETRF